MLDKSYICNKDVTVKVTDLGTVVNCLIYARDKDKDKEVD